MSNPIKLVIAKSKSNDPDFIKGARGTGVEALGWLARDLGRLRNVITFQKHRDRKGNQHQEHPGRQRSLIAAGLALI